MKNRFFIPLIFLLVSLLYSMVLLITIELIQIALVPYSFLL